MDDNSTIWDQIDSTGLEKEICSQQNKVAWVIFTITLMVIIFSSMAWMLHTGTGMFVHISPDEYVISTNMNRQTQVYDASGTYFKWPFAKVYRYPKRIRIHYKTMREEKRKEALQMQLEAIIHRDVPDLMEIILRNDPNLPEK